MSQETMSKSRRLNALRRCRPADDPAVIDAARELAAESLAEFISRKIAETPPLTDEQVERLRALLPAPLPRHDTERTIPVPLPTYAAPQSDGDVA